jgi:putative flippase GtrA
MVLTHARDTLLAAADSWPLDFGKPILIQATKYGATGIVNAVLGFSVIFMALIFGASDIAANVMGYSVGIVSSFSLNRSWTFAHKGPIPKSLLRFLMIVGFAYCCNLMVVLLTHRTFGLNVYLAQILGAAFYSSIVFLGSRYIAFADKP